MEEIWSSCMYFEKIKSVFQQFKQAKTSDQCGYKFHG
jgi:hypothetical protein